MSFADAIDDLYNAEADLRIVARAIEGAIAAGSPVSELGVSSLIERIADGIGRPIDALERRERKQAS